MPGAPPAVVAGPQGLVPAGGALSCSSTSENRGRAAVLLYLFDRLILLWKIYRDRISPKT